MVATVFEPVGGEAMQVGCLWRQVETGGHAQAFSAVTQHVDGQCEHVVVVDRAADRLLLATHEILDVVAIEQPDLVLQSLQEFEHGAGLLC